MAVRTRAARGLGTVSIDTLQMELRRRQRGLTGLQRKYQKAAAKAAGFAREIEALGGSVNGQAGRRRSGAGVARPKNDKGLVEYLGQVLKGKQLGVSEAADAVLKLGYQSNAANFRVIVNQALLKGGPFKKVERGVYTAK